MNKTYSFNYRDWIIHPFAIPLPEGKWSASCEIECVDADGVDSFQNAMPICIGNTEQDAISAACDATKHQIDGIIADPLG